MKSNHHHDVSTPVQGEPPHVRPEARPAPTTGGHMAHDHDKHAGHSPDMFRHRFWLSALLTVPILYFDQHFQAWFGYQAVAFP
jgi:P-type Cu2+ transporter